MQFSGDENHLFFRLGDRLLLSRKLTGNFTFVVVTDRDDLDGQIYRNFLHTGVVAPKDDVRPKGSAQLREMLGKDKDRLDRVWLVTDQAPVRSFSSPSTICATSP